jgi:hypothetical protein
MLVRIHLDMYACVHVYVYTYIYICMCIDQVRQKLEITMRSHLDKELGGVVVNGGDFSSEEKAVRKFIEILDGLVVDFNRDCASAVGDLKSDYICMYLYIYIHIYIYIYVHIYVFFLYRLLGEPYNIIN